MILRGIVRTLLSPQICGRERLPDAGPVIVAPVHHSNADFLALSLLSDRPLVILAKSELFAWPLARWLLPRLGLVPVDRARADRAALDQVARLLSEGRAVVMFPEGTTRSRDDHAPLRDGVAFLALRTGAPIVPVGLAGTDQVLPRGRRVPRIARLAICLGAPITPVLSSVRATRREVQTITAALTAALEHAELQALELLA
jgi:1-acyl-sn-glycerol-3-phosphate acyltransferase